MNTSGLKHDSIEYGNSLNKEGQSAPREARGEKAIHRGPALACQAKQVFALE